MLEIPTIFDIKARVSTIYITAVNLALSVRSNGIKNRTDLL